ncbi:hypothetical protein [Rhodococcus sp. UNC363MFTsu5.1]|uniref:hypothetical protein n=1 Tax=Rhodococcus sp. UNC363MFTsu5.1 TaxID=1449069 RepID=UPI0004814F17|nr:hypothetical protein [Rhodococcus sp. UNC363MFTsu5.1]
MNSLVEALSSDTAPWWAVPLSMIVGILLGVFAVRRGRSSPTPEPARAIASDPQARSTYVRFLAAADRAHNSIVEVDHAVLAEADLEESLESDDPKLKALARSIVEMDAMANELRICAPGPVVGATVALFGFVTDSTIDGVTDQDAFRTRYNDKKAALIGAIRESLGEQPLTPAR